MSTRMVGDDHKSNGNGAVPSSSLSHPSQRGTARFFVLSHDALRTSERFDQNIPGGWQDHPPLFEGKKERHLLKECCRAGIPPALRCAVWITSVVRASHPHQPKELADEYGTLGRVTAVEHTWDLVLKQTFPDTSDENDAVMPDFGLHPEAVKSLLNESHGGTPIPPQGIRALTRVLCCLQHMHGIDYAPLLPDLAAVLLNCMPEAYAYSTLREIVNESSRFLPLSMTDHYSYCRTFADLMKRMYPQSALEMEDNGSLSPKGLDPIFRRFFTPIMRYEHVLRIMDIYSIEGSKVLFRFGTALIAMYKKELKEMKLKDAKSWWDKLREFCYSPAFDFEELVSKAYGPVGSRWRKRVQFPRRRTISRMIRFNEEWAAGHVSARRVGAPPKPMGFVKGEVDIVLAKPAVVRASLAQWMPYAYKSTKLDLIFSTNEHGRTLEAFYTKCSRTKHTLCLVEVLNTGAVIGMFASNAWVTNKRPKIYGNGECFLFRANPDPECYKWRPTKDETQSNALLEQFMVSCEDYIAMGGNKDGSSGLRLNEDLTKGESAQAVGFNNDPLAGEESTLFEVGLVEVYRLVREVDGRPVDGEDDPMWNLDGVSLH